MKKTTQRSEIVDTLSLEELCRFCQADRDWIVELVEQGAIEPKGASVEKWYFLGVNIARAKKARRLTHDLGVNAAGAAMILDLLEERDFMMRRLAQYETE